MTQTMKILNWLKERGIIKSERVSVTGYKDGKKKLCGYIIKALVSNLGVLLDKWLAGEEIPKGINQRLAKKVYECFDKVNEGKTEGLIEIANQLTELRNINAELVNKIQEKEKQIIVLKNTLVPIVPQKELGDYTPRELMDDLFKRGYRGTLEFEVHEIRKATLGR